MFRHQGKNRTQKHNLAIAIVLSFVAGIVNVTGFLAFQQLTTNVTGHFAFFVYDVASSEFWKGTMYFLYIFSFFLGSFSSGLLIDKFRETKKLNVFVLPTLLESLILLAIGSQLIPLNYPDLIICSLLFAMGLQNSFVTKISNAVVRTTHLTGHFTDLGIELSHLLFPKSHPNREKLKANIKLRLFIIASFFAGGLLGWYFYSELDLKLKTLIIGAVILILSLFFDDLRYNVIKTKRKYNQSKFRKPKT